MSRHALALLSVLPVLGCSHGGGGSSGGSGSSGYVDSGPTYPDIDAGPPLDAGPIFAPGFGPFTGAYTVNGGGLLLALQIDGRLGLLLNDEPNAYLGFVDAGGPVDAGELDAGHLDAGHLDAGHLDAGHEDAGELDAGHLDAGHEDAGHLDAGVEIASELFQTEIVYADLEACGPVTLAGVYDVAAFDYTAVNDYCAAGSPVSIAFPGARFVGEEFFRQDLARSGVFDVTETAGVTNACQFPSAGPYHALVGFSVGLDGGPAMAMVVGDGTLDEIDIPQPPSGAALSAQSVDSQGKPMGLITLQPGSGASWTGTRTFTYLGSDGGAAPCVASMSLAATRRTE